MFIAADLTVGLYIVVDLSSVVAVKRCSTVNLHMLPYTAITCEVPTIANGTVTNSAFDSDEMQTNETVEYGTEIIYRCNAGFSLAGDYLPRTCRQSNNSGVWSGTAPYCKRK